MELFTLRLFADVMHRRNFAAVARDHGLAPSSVSRAISSLEHELGVKLFQRSTRQIEPTEAGINYFDRIISMLDQLEQAQQLTKKWNERPKGVLRMTVPVTFGQICVVPLLPELKNLYPDLAFDILMTDSVVDLLVERIDLAIRFGSLPDSMFIAKRLYPADFVVCASPSYIEQYGKPQSPRQIRDHECNLWPMPGFSSSWRFRDNKQTITEVPVQGRYRISNALALKQCALADTGITLLSRMVVKDELNNGSLVDLFPDYDVTATDFDIAVWLVYPSRDYLPLKVKLIVEFLQKKFREIPPY